MSIERTPNFGLTRLSPDESINADNSSLQDRNPAITDAILRVGAITHRHDEHAALADPTVDAVATALAAGGTIPSDTDIFVTYTLIDAQGGETRPGPVEQVTTQPGLATPLSAPAVAADLLSGTLRPDTYYYAVTVTDATGGETPLGPTAIIVIPSGSAMANVVLSGLDAIVTDSGGTGWRLWRTSGGDFGFIAEGTSATYTDDGSVRPDCTVDPPFTIGDTNRVNVLRVNVPSAGQPADAVSFSLYASLDGAFNSPSLLGTFPIADFDSNQDFPTLAFLNGSPPPVSLALPGASKILATSDIDWTGYTPPGGGGGGGSGGPPLIYSYAKDEGAGLAIPTDTGSGAAAVESTLTVPDNNIVPARVVVTVHIDHGEPADLDLTLVVPADTHNTKTVEVKFQASADISHFFGVDGYGDVGKELAFDDFAPTPIGDPRLTGTRYIGSFKPTTPIRAALLDDQTTLGDWKLRIQDTSGNGPGTLFTWGLHFIPEEDDDPKRDRWVPYYGPGFGALASNPAVDANWLFGVNYNGKVIRIAKHSRDTALQIVNVVGSAVDVAVHDTHVYWANSASGAIGRSTLTGGSISQAFVSTGDGALRLAVDGSYIFFINNGGNQLCRANLAGTGLNATFVIGDDFPEDLCLSDDYMFWTMDNGCIGRVKKDGTGVNQTFVNTGGTYNLVGIVCDGDYIYWGDLATGYIGRASVHGGYVDATFINAGVVAGGSPNGPGGGGYPQSMALDAEHVYWINHGAGTIGRARKDGTNVEQPFLVNQPLIQTPPAEPANLLIDSGELYWTTENDAVLWRRPVAYADDLTEVEEARDALVPQTGWIAGTPAPRIYRHGDRVYLRGAFESSAAITPGGTDDILAEWTGHDLLPAGFPGPGSAIYTCPALDNDGTTWGTATVRLNFGSGGGYDAGELELLAVTAVNPATPGMLIFLDRIDFRAA